MTLSDISVQLFTLTNGRINGEHFTKAQLDKVVRMWMRETESFTLKNRYVITVTLPDGNWPATIDKFADSADGYDYWIPETKAQAEAFWKRFQEAVNAKVSR